MKEKYADTIRKKAVAAKQLPQNTKKPIFFVTRFNRRLWPLIISPLFTLLYYPVNRYVMLPKFGSGRAYVDMNGALIENYFSANSVALILFYLLIVTTEILLVRTSRSMKLWQRVLFYLGTAILNCIMGFFFLEFTIWE